SEGVVDGVTDQPLGGDATGPIDVWSTRAVNRPVQYMERKRWRRALSPHNTTLLHPSGEQSPHMDQREALSDVQLVAGRTEKRHGEEGEHGRIQIRVPALSPVLRHCGRSNELHQGSGRALQAG